MPCPFGFTGDDAEDEASATEEEEEEEEEPKTDAGHGGEVEEDTAEKKAKKPVANGKPAKPASPAVDHAKDVQAAKEAREARRKARAKLQEEAAGEFDYEKDPVKWFYANQIKTEADFQKKKDALRAEARKRLDDILAKKGKMMDWAQDSELDELSIRSSELSDWDSDVNSLCSIMSCANSWIENAKYPTPAENTLKTVSMVAMAALCYCLFMSINATNLTRKVVGVVANSWWPVSSFVACTLCGVFLLLLLLAASYRSRRMLLGGQAGLLLAYSAFLVLTVAIATQPTIVDPKMREAACTRYSKSDMGSRLCKMLPDISAQLGDAMQNLMWGNSLAAVLCLSGLTVSCWYLMEIAYIEKKAIKHKRRHKRRKHSIPWEKIKIVGPVTNCGSTANAVASAKAGKCPVMHAPAKPAAGGGGAAPSGKCPMSFMSGGAAGTDKKIN